VHFNFTSEGTSYYFLFDSGLSGARQVSVDILTIEKVPAFWKTAVPWVGVILSVASLVLPFLKEQQLI